MKKIRYDILGYSALIILAAFVLLFTCLGSRQAIPSMLMGVSFQGEYRIGESEWTPIVKGKSISAMEGDVTLRGNFVLETPEGEVLGPVAQGSSIALCFNHIAGEIYMNGEMVHEFDAENPLIGKSACGEYWITYIYTGQDTDTLEIVLRNPHKYGNYNAVNQFLDSMRPNPEESFENMMLKEGRGERTVGFVIIVMALIVIGAAMFSSLMRVPQSNMMWLIGIMMFFAGGMFLLESPNISFWNSLMAFNTTALQLCRMLYFFFMMCLIVKCLKQKIQKPGIALTVVLGAALGGFLIISCGKDIKLYDTGLYWAGTQVLVAIPLLGFCIYSLIHSIGERKRNWTMLLFCCVLALDALLADIAAIALGWWNGMFVSKIVFLLIFVVALIIVLKIIPSYIRAGMREKELKAELQNNRISIMLSQIQPHFLYNAITTIRELCRHDPEQARDALGDFSDYLRGNMDSLSSDGLIHFSRELSHIETYLKLEKLRFGEELQIVYDIGEEDFFLPPLTVQPLVENAVKHGIRKSEKGGTLTLRTRRDGEYVLITVMDDGIGFDTKAQVWENDDCRTHVGIENVKNRLQQMIKGSLTLESSPGAGTTVTIRLKSEGGR